ncbi:MAG: hypothetical protein MUC71_12430 [Steroidobacteraceae bacterium]|jgi:hypothetical protein|nr:hypothetical protein [Steroidobacteraceae bacterium]
MFTMINESTRRMFSAFAAVAVVGFTGLAMDQAHIASAPRGVVEIGELVPVAEAQIAQVEFPEIEVTASRLAPSPTLFAGELPRLSELVVVGRREVSVADAATKPAGNTQG